MSGRRTVNKLWGTVCVTAIIVVLVAYLSITKRRHDSGIAATDSNWLNHTITEEEVQATFKPFVEVPESDRLTVEETMGLALCDEGCWGLERWAHPDANPQLWEVIETDDDGIYRFQVVAYGILGYTGDGRDVEGMLGVLRSYSGVLNQADNNRVGAILHALGMMALRGVDEAAKSLDEMSDLRYWKNSFQYKPENLVQEGELTSDLHWIAIALDAQAIAGKRELGQLCRALTSGIANQKRRHAMAWQVDPVRLRLGAASNRHYFGSRIPTEQERRSFRMSYERRAEIMSAGSRAVRDRSKEFPEWMRPKPLRMEETTKG